MSRRLLLLCFVFVTSTGFSQTTESVVREIAKYNVYEGRVVGFAGLLSKQYERFEILAAKAGREKLISLASNHSNAVVRLYAFQALIFNKEPIPKELKEKFASDKTSVKTLSGCIGGEKKVSDILPHQF